MTKIISETAADSAVGEAAAAKEAALSALAGIVFVPNAVQKYRISEVSNARM